MQFQQALAPYALCGVTSCAVSWSVAALLPPVHVPDTPRLPCWVTVSAAPYTPLVAPAAPAQHPAGFAQPHAPPVPEPAGPAGPAAGPAAAAAAA